jgi:hypothetical protein
VRPALTGLALPRTSRRPVGPLDLRRTVAANLHTAREVDGVLRLAPDRLLFRTRARRSLHWHLVLVVDVSGSYRRSLPTLPATASDILAHLPLEAGDSLWIDTFGSGYRRGDGPGDGRHRQ